MLIGSYILITFSLLSDQYDIIFGFFLYFSFASSSISNQSIWKYYFGLFLEDDLLIILFSLSGICRS